MIKINVFCKRISFTVLCVSMCNNLFVIVKMANVYNFYNCNVTLGQHTVSSTTKRHIKRRVILSSDSSQES